MASLVSLLLSRMIQGPCTTGIQRQGIRFLSSVSCPFHVLGIPRASPYSEVKAAFVKLALEHHPDTSTSKCPSSGDQFTRIRQAFESIQQVNGQTKVIEQPQQWSDESLRIWILHETGQNLSFQMNAETRRQVASAASLSQGGLDKGGMWELARTIARQENESPAMDAPLQIERAEQPRRRRR